MKPSIACFLILSLVISASAREQTPLQQAQKIAPGSKVVVKLKDKRTLKGRLGEVTQDRFALEPLAPGSSSGVVVFFQDVRKIDRAKVLPEPVKKVLMVPVAVVLTPPWFVYIAISCTLFNHGCLSPI
jgi:hypothetical protein